MPHSTVTGAQPTVQESLADQPASLSETMARSSGEPTAQATDEVLPPVPVVLWPLVVFNQIVDGILGWLGPPGWLLRSGFGKNVLAMIGIGLIAYTLAHIGEHLGLLSLPFPLPWPE